jgi:DNA polymerase-3 subunit delta'
VSWQRVRGHEAQTAAFDRVVRRGRLAHAYLFTGNPGIGKRLFADELAKALLCEGESPCLEACDKCPSCIQAAAGTHPDLFVVTRPEENLEMPIAKVRELSKRFSLKSARGRGKVAIVDDADDFNDASANCFLKTLEEPPPRSVIILIGTNPDRQLPTVLSRCQVIHFRPPPPAMVAELLRAAGVEDPAWAERLAHLAGGSPAKALALADNSLWQFRRDLVNRLAQVPCDTPALALAWMHFVEEAGKESAQQRRRASLILELLIQFLNAALDLSFGGTPEVVEPEDQRILETLATRLSTDQLLAILERCLEADVQIDRRVQLVLVLEALSDAMGRLAIRQ